MNKKDVEKIIKESPSFQEFIQGRSGFLSCEVCGVPIVICKESNGVEYYYKLPYSSQYRYNDVECFMRYAIPILSKLVKDKDSENLVC